MKLNTTILALTGWAVALSTLLMTAIPDAAADPDPGAVASGSAPCIGDVNGDLVVDVDDLVAVILAWGPCPGCPFPLTDCGGICVDTSSSFTNCGACGTVCPFGTQCENGSCVTVCPPGTTDCAGVCIDLDSDDSNCGACGTQCPFGTQCENGSCVTVCPPGTTDCGGVCVDLDSDDSNCGGCGSVCPPGSSCVNGACVLD